MSSRIFQSVILQIKEATDRCIGITIKGDLVTLRGVMKEGDIPALEALADAILA